MDILNDYVRIALEGTDDLMIRENVVLHLSKVAIERLSCVKEIHIKTDEQFNKAMFTLDSLIHFMPYGVVHRETDERAFLEMAASIASHIQVLQKYEDLKDEKIRHICKELIKNDTTRCYTLEDLEKGFTMWDISFPQKPDLDLIRRMMVGHQQLKNTYQNKHITSQNRLIAARLQGMLLGLDLVIGTHIASYKRFAKLIDQFVKVIMAFDHGFTQIKDFQELYIDSVTS